MHIFIKHFKESIKNNNKRNSFLARKNYFRILKESEYEIERIYNQPQSYDNPPPNTPGSQWVWGPDGWTDFGSSYWRWDAANGQWISTIGTFNGTTFYTNENGEIFAESQNSITPQVMDAPLGGYQHPGDPSFGHETMMTLMQIGRPGVGITPATGQPGISMGQIGHWFYLDSMIEQLMQGSNPFTILSDEDINQGASAPFSVTARNFGFLILLEQLFENAFLSGWKYETSVSSNGNLIVRFYQMVNGIPRYLTNLGQSPILAQLLHNATQLSSQISTVWSNIRNMVAAGGAGTLTSAQLLQAFGGRIGLQSLMSNLVAVGVPAAVILGMVASIAFSAYTIYSQTGNYTQENIDNLLGSLLTVITDPTTAFAQFAAAWQALFGTTAPNWFSSTSGIDWNALPDWLREFLINNIPANSVPAPKPNTPQLLPAYDIQPGQPGWSPRRPTADELNSIMDRFQQQVQSTNPGSMGGNP